jgi:hypothetical protein
MDCTQATPNGFYHHIGMTAVGDVGKISNILPVEGQAYEGISHGIFLH